MRCSLFGKLAAKRDFIALSAPRDFLNAWEPWMQGCVSASRDTLGRDWQQTYLTAPIWRFWLGADICGATVVGAFMSSLDGVGRYYPLTLFAYADPHTAFAPPDIETHAEWFAATEDFLLSTLGNDVTFEAITDGLARLAAPAQQPVNSWPEGMSVLAEGTIATRPTGGSFSETFRSLCTANYSSIYAAATFWWTVGGGDYRELAFCCRQMPDPFLFTNILTGRINSATA
jgi:type VI secretion system protein ImpM